jgi:hypothetical protein
VPGRRRRIGKLHVDRGAHLDVEALVRLVDAIDVDRVAEMVDVLHRQRRQRLVDDADRVTFWPGNARARRWAMWCAESTLLV